MLLYGRDSPSAYLLGNDPMRLGAKLLHAAIFACLLSGAGQAQGVNYTSVDATGTKPVQLTYHATGNKNCSPEPAPTIQVTDPPKNGVLTVRDGQLTTERFSGCGKIQVPVRVVFYEAKDGYSGKDHVRYDVTDVAGKVSTYDVTINVKASTPPPSPPETSPRSKI
jgi:hypothetical protein